MAENRRRGSAPDKEALAALGTAGPSRLRKAAAGDVVTELAAPAPAPVEPTGKSSMAAQKRTSYQQKKDADRMPAAYLNTQVHTRYRSLSEFINAPIDEKVSSLEQAYNGGVEWPPLAAREIPLRNL